MEVRVLGPLEAVRDGRRIPLGGPQAEKALALLLLAGGATVGVDELVGALWDGEPPATAVHQLHKLVAGLRRRLPGVLETAGRGYRADVPTDLAAFGALAATATVDGLTAALALWRGPALAGLDSRVLRARAAVLDERRLGVLEELADLRLAAGEAPVDDLRAAVLAHPLREPLRARLMLALHRAGRQADALAVWAETRALLAAELGVDPGPELVRAQAVVLGPGRPAAPCTLPYDLPDFAGRGADLARLLAPGGGPGGTVVITAIDGMAGIGKTALAVHAAHRLAARYPDGQLFCDLHAHTPGAPVVPAPVALERLLRMFGVPPDGIPDGAEDRAARWRAELAGRRVLVVLDNAASAAQVRPLLPGTAGCLALVTSRARLGMLDGAAVLSLDVLPAAEALELFATVAGGARVAAEPAAAAEVVALCGFLPLALRIAGTRLAHRPTWTVASLAGRLRARTGRLAELSVADRGVGPAFALSYAHLPASTRRVFRLLGGHPGADFDAHSVAALTGLPVGAAEAELEALLDAHLLRSPGPGRYSFHDLLREYARSLAPAAVPSLHGYFLAAATAAVAVLAPETARAGPGPYELPELSDVDGALAWLTAEHETLVAVALATADWRLPAVLRPYFEHLGHFADWRTTHEHALRHADPRGATLLRFNLGTLAMWTDRLEEGMDRFRGALGDGLLDPPLAAIALTNLGMLAHLLHRDVEAAGYLRRALAIDHTSARTTALGWNNLALTEGRLGRRDAALRHHRRALALARRVDSTSAERAILLGLGETSLRLRLPAVREFSRALELARAGHFRMQQALALDGLAHATGETAYWDEALAILTDLGVGQADRVRRHLASPGAACCDLCAGRATSTVDTARPARG